MNRSQKIILLVGSVFIAAMLLCPPWDYFDPETSGHLPAGYRFFLYPAAPRPASEIFPDARTPHLVHVELNDLRFIFQLATVVPLVIGLTAAFHSRRWWLSVALAVVLIGLSLFVLGFDLWLVVTYRLQAGHWEMIP
jgi:hypothetical protein